MRLSGFICVTAINSINVNQEQCNNNWSAEHCQRLQGIFIPFMRTGMKNNQ